MKYSLRSTWILVLVNFVILSCGDDADKDKAAIGLKVRASVSDASNFSLSQLSRKFPSLTNLLDSPRQSTMFELEYYKVPISRINLVSGLSGSGYGQASPDLYACAAATDEQCLVNLADKEAVDNLLKTVGVEGSEAESAEGAVETEMEPATYEGVGVEFCHEFNSLATGSDETSHFEARFKGSVDLNNTIYYTNATTGLSEVGPAEEVKVTVENTGCGVTTPLFEPITLSKDTSANVVLYTDPTFAVFGTTDANAANSSCLGENSLAICTGAVAVFGTVDDTPPTVEMYLLNLGIGKAEVAATILFDSADEPFGATFRHIYADASNQEKVLHSSVSISSIVKDGDKLDLKTWSSTDEAFTADFIKGFERADHSGVILELVNEDTAYDASVK